VAAPRVRKLANEETILTGALVITAVVGFGTAMIGGLIGAAALSMTVGATGSAAKQAFDAIVQRDAPDANRGRSFARFETRFQLFWVTGALVPIIIPIPAAAGFAVIAIGAATTVVTYQIGLRRLRRGEVPVRRPLWGRLRRGSAAQTGLGVALDDATVVDDRTEVAADRTVVGGPAGRPASPPDAGSGSDPTVVESGARRAARPPTPPPSVPPPGAASGADPARRWMRSAAPGAADPPPAGDPQPGPDPPPAAGPEPAAPSPSPSLSPSPPTARPDGAVPPDDGPEHRRQGLLFDPEAWDDASGPPPD
jgi:hypothetical protein